MPLRHMLGDSLSYLKEYNEIADRNKMDKDFQSSDEFLSNFKKTDRLHPVVSLCVYYGENEWDGPFCLSDMLEIPEKLNPFISDYKMNLLQLRKSGFLHFRNSDVNVVFDVSRAIYERDFEKINTLYKNQEISAELGVVIGAITESQKLIDHALQSERRGGQINMCSALEELVNEGVERGRQEGIREGISANIKVCKRFNMSKSDVVQSIMKDFSVSEKDAAEYVEMYW